MSFSNAFRVPDVTNMADISTASITQLPANLLEAFIPGYSVISKFVLEALGIDITLVVSVCLLMFGLLTTSTFLWRHISDFFEKYCMSVICVESHDDIYEHLMVWLSAQKVTQNSRSLMAKTGREIRMRMSCSTSATGMQRFPQSTSPSLAVTDFGTRACTSNLAGKLSRRCTPVMAEEPSSRTMRASI